MANKLLISTALATLALGVSASATLAQDRCIDEHCTMQSLESLDGFVTDAPAPGGAASTAATRYGTWGIDLAGMDTSVKPGDSFFDYVNGTAVKNMVIPDDKTSYGSFIALVDLSEARSKAIIEGLAAKPNLSGDDAKIAAIYKAMMDEAAAEKRDAAPLQPKLKAIAAITSKTDMAAYMGKTAAGFGSAFFNAYIGEDAKNPKFDVLQLSQSGLGLPDRDYYLKDSFAAKKAKYETYVADTLRAVGYADPEGNAKAIVAMETRIADVSWTRIDRRDDTKTYNSMTLADVATLAPGFDWAAFFKGAEVDKASKAIVAENTAFPKIAQVFADTPLDTIKAWETFRTVDQAAPYLSKRFVDLNWTFRSHELSGAQAQRPRWKRAISAVQGEIGEGLGRDYVAAYFPPESKAKMEALVADLRAALKVRIDNLTWMSDATKAKAQEKLGKFGVKIAYPNKWRDYTKLIVKDDDLYGNAERSSAFQWDYELSKLDKPVDPEEWGMTPQTVNAYYSSTRNEIVFPAAILQPPFFDPKADMAVNYGGIGGVIGHEITHGFDDQGRHSDGDGVLQDWWTAEDSAKFEAQAKIYGAQYDQFEPLPGVHVQGGLTMGENIADLGGNLLGLDAYHRYLNGKDAP
ncbi:MAG: peptidase M13, partial [Asticcacaulis sp.]|nr:peptidase M13 [Asticcacaulis sp.]